MTDRKLKTIFLVSWIFPGKANSVILFGFVCAINTQNLNKIVWAIFEKLEIKNFFLMWTTLHFEGRSKTKQKIKNKKRRQEIFATGLQISNLNKIGQLAKALRYVTDRKLKTIFLVSRIFPGKADSVILLGFECTIYRQNLNKIVRAIFEKIEILNFFLTWTTFNYEDSSKTKRKVGDICTGTPDVVFEQDWPFGLGAMLCDGQKTKNNFSSFRNFSGKKRKSYYWASIVL